MALKGIIVEDEKASRETLKAYLDKYCKQLTVAGEAENIKQGKELIEQHHPDIVFLDVEMPYGNAFDLLEQLETRDFETIFITAYDNYAMKALNFSASYYILKPIDIDELVKAVELISNKKKTDEHAIRTQVLIDNLKIENKQLQKIILPLIDGFEVVRVGDIIRCQANDNMTWFHFTDKSKKLVCRTLKHYDEVLSEFDFVRVHKSHLINLQHVKRYRKGKGGQVILSDDSEVEVSQLKKSDFLGRFK
ncbi:MAG: LytTR family DNA-binding domain-containing protein [Bacteroidales bacterium]|nr:LytTR family DNA-binding domain-containing protein [Bacteroidales bacterium]